MTSAILLVEIIQLVLLVYTMKQFFELGLELIGRQQYYIVSGTYIIVQLLNTMFQVILQPVMRLVLNVLFIFLFCYLVFYGKLYKKILFTILFEVLWLLTEISATYGMIFIKNSPYLDVFVTSITMIILFGLVQVLQIKMKKVNRYSDIPRKHRILLLLVPSVSIIFALIIYYLVETMEVSYNIFIPLFSIGLLMILNVALFVAYDKLIDDIMIQRQNILYEQQLSLYRKQAEEREDSALNLVNLRHDMKNHLLYIRELTDLDDKNGIIQYTEKLLEASLKRKGSIAKSGNIVIDSLINYKYTKAKQEQIRFDVEITVPVQLPYDEGDILIILGNALDNALEAAEKVEDGERFVYVSITVRKMDLLIVIRNSFDGQVILDSENKLLTTKKNSINHGIGMASMNKAAEKYHGIVEIEMKEKRFMLSILLFSPEN